MIRAEKQSGTSTQGRAELRTVLDFIGKGDVLLVTRVDRLARSIGDLQDIVRTLKTKGASLRATEQPIDTSTAAGKCFLDMLGVFAEFETNLRRERHVRLRLGHHGRSIQMGHQRRFDVGGMSAIAPIATKMLRRDERRKGHVWTAPAVQDEFGVLRSVRVQPCIRPVFAWRLAPLRCSRYGRWP